MFDKLKHILRLLHKLKIQKGFKTTVFQVVKIPWPSNSSYDQLTPSHVTVRRCSGGCHGGLTSCVPTSTQLRKVAVLLARWVFLTFLFYS